MIQTIGRITKGSNHKYVYILSGFDLQLDRPIKTYKSHTDFRNRLLVEDIIKNERKKEREEENKMYELLA